MFSLLESGPDCLVSSSDPNLTSSFDDLKTGNYSSVLPKDGGGGGGGGNPPPDDASTEDPPNEDNNTGSGAENPPSADAPPPENNHTGSGAEICPRDHWKRTTVHPYFFAFTIASTIGYGSCLCI